MNRNSKNNCIMRKKCILMILSAVIMAFFISCGHNQTQNEETMSRSEQAEMVKQAVGCSEEKAEYLLAQLEEITGSGVQYIDIRNMAEMHEDIRRIFSVRTQKGDHYLVSVKKDHTISKVVHTESKTTIYETK